jgi:acylphosphatase
MKLSSWRLGGENLCFAGSMAGKRIEARRWLVRGRVQGVGFRYFAQRAALELGVTGYARNLDDGRVEVYGAGPREALEALAGRLHRGPRWADVRGVEEQEAAVHQYGSFVIES